MKVEKSNKLGIDILYSEVFEDHRGFFREIYSKNGRTYTSLESCNFVSDAFSCSEKYVLRGIHGDTKTWKLISCLYGKVYSVVVNCDENSSDFGKWESFVLSKSNGKQILVPPMYGNSFLVLSDSAVVYYKQTTFYGEEKQFTYKWNDERFNIFWPIQNPILSERDSGD